MDQRVGPSSIHILVAVLVCFGVLIAITALIFGVDTTNRVDRHRSVAAATVFLACWGVGLGLLLHPASITMTADDADTQFSQSCEHAAVAYAVARSGFSRDEVACHDESRVLVAAGASILTAGSVVAVLLIGSGGDPSHPARVSLVPA